MIQNLSKREKILLFAAALLVIFYLAFQFAILPLFNRYMDDLDERNNLSIERMMVEHSISRKAEIRQSHTTAQEQFDRIKQEYPLLIPNEEIDPVLTNLCLSNDLIPSTLRFIGSVGIPEAKGTAGGEHDYLLTLVNVSMNVTGSYRSLLGLLEDVDSMQYIRITSLSYAAVRQAGAAEDSRIAITFELTYVNPQ